MKLLQVAALGQIQQALVPEVVMIQAFRLHLHNLTCHFGGKESPSPHEEVVSLLDCSISSEVSWTPPLTPQKKNTVRCSPGVPKTSKK